MFLHDKFTQDNRSGFTTEVDVKPESFVNGKVRRNTSRVLFFIPKSSFLIRAIRQIRVQTLSGP